MIANCHQSLTSHLISASVPTVLEHQMRVDYYPSLSSISVFVSRLLLSVFVLTFTCRLMRLAFYTAKKVL